MISYNITRQDSGQFSWVFVDNQGEIHEGMVSCRQEAIEELGREYTDEIIGAVYAQIDGEPGMCAIEKAVDHCNDQVWDECCIFFEESEKENN